MGFRSAPTHPDRAAPKSLTSTDWSSIANRGPVLTNHADFVAIDLQSGCEAYAHFNDRRDDECSTSPDDAIHVPTRSETPASRLIAIPAI